MAMLLFLSGKGNRMEVLNALEIEAVVDVTKLVAAIGVLAFIVSCIAEVLKHVKWLDTVLPTGVVVILLSLVICPVTILGMLAYAEQPITWFMVFASFIAAFIVALVAMDGWERVTELAGKLIKRE